MLGLQAWPRCTHPLAAGRPRSLRGSGPLGTPLSRAATLVPDALRALPHLAEALSSFKTQRKSHPFKAAWVPQVALSTSSISRVYMHFCVST